jgi:hypothetical protein
MSEPYGSFPIVRASWWAGPYKSIGLFVAAFLAYPLLGAPPVAAPPQQESPASAATAVVTVLDLPSGGTLEAIDEGSGVRLFAEVDEARTSLRVPAGPQIVCARDPEARPLGCWPVRPKASETATITGLPRLAKGRAQLLAEFIYPSTEVAHDLAPALRILDTAVRPDALVAVSPDRQLAVWFDIPSGPASLEGTSKWWRLTAPAAVRVADRVLSSVKISVARRPRLDVRLFQVELLGPGEVEVELFPCDKLVQLDLPPILMHCGAPLSGKGRPDGLFSFPDLVPGAYALRWTKPPFQAVRWVDLRDGASREEVVPVELTEIRGRVTRRGAGIVARLRFESNNAGVAADAVTDEDGRYRVVVAQPGGYSVTVRNETGPEHGAGCWVPRQAAQVECDIDVPANAITVRVRTEDGSDVPPSARVTYRVDEPPPSGKTIHGPGSLSLGADGAAELPPLPNGVLSSEARADGYRVTSAAPLVVADDTKVDVTIVLRKGTGIRFTLVDPSGRPAAGARLWSRRDLQYGVITDTSGVGRWEQPLAPGSPLLSFDQGGRMLFARYTGDPEQTLRFPEPGPPVSVRFLSPDGKPVPGNNVVVGIDGVLDESRYSDQALAAGGDLYSGADGRLRVAGLPASGLLTLYPPGRPDLAVSRDLPVREEIVFTLPLPAGGKPGTN